MPTQRQIPRDDSRTKLSSGDRAAGKRRLLPETPIAKSLSVVIVLVTLALGTVVWRYLAVESSTARGLAALNLAYRKSRPFEARISGFEYAPAITFRGRREAVNEATRDQAERLLLEASERSSGSALHALGKLYLTKHEFQKAMNYFQAALGQSDNAQIRNDMGVALFEMSQEKVADDATAGSALELLARSLESFDAALALDPANPDALYNRALALSNMKVPQQAKTAWNSVLERESHPQWRAEAQNKLKLQDSADVATATAPELLTAFVSASEAADDERAWEILSKNQEMIAEKYIPEELARAYLKQSLAANSTGTAQMLRALQFAGRLSKTKALDPFVSDLADYYSRLTPRRRTVLHDAHLNLVAGFGSCLAADYAGALGRFEQARHLFNQEHDECEAAISDYWIAYCLSQHDGLRDSTTLITNLADYSEKKHYNWMRGQALSWLASNQVELNEHSKAIETANLGLSIAEKIDDSYNRQKILAIIGNEYIYMAQPSRALAYNWRALDLTDAKFTGVRQIWRNYLYTTRSLIALHIYGAATVYANEMLSLALTRINDPAVTHFSYLNLAQIYFGQQQLEKAIETARQSLKVSQGISDGRVSRKLSAGSLRVLGHLQRQAGHLSEALESYDRAIQIYDGMELGLYNYDAHKGRLLCYAALHDTSRFETELPIVLAQFEQYREKITEEQNRNAFFDREQSVYDLAIAHAFEQDDAFAALDYSERSRARSLLAALKSSATAPAPKTLAEIQATIPAEVQIVEYSVLSDRIVIWLISRDAFKSFIKPVSSDLLTARVSDYLRILSAGPGREDVGSRSRELFDLAIAPVISDLDPQKIICLIPDKALSALPFATLQSTRSGRYLISDFTLMSSPSLGVFLHCTETAEHLAEKNSEVLLAIGNPTFARSRHPDLGDLAAATKEAEAISGNYSKTYKFIGRAALKAAIVKRLPEVDVFHFAGHYLIDEQHPLQSRLVLAGDNKADGAETESDLTGNDLVGLKLPHARLAVLSGCQTGGEAYFNGEGLIGVSRMFLETGIPLVVASQWAVDSESTAQLMIKFHRYRKTSGLSSVNALRKAQLEMLNDPNGLYRDPFYWAAFVPVGGHATF